MPTLFHLQTPRLLLRQWQDDDLPAFAELNGDAEVMTYFPQPLSQQQSDETAEKLRNHISEHGWGVWAVELLDNKEFVGAIGLFPNAITPRGEAVEIAWRLRRQFWGHGYATEGAKAALLFAFEVLNLNAIIALTASINKPSRKVMERLGMTNCEENFQHPEVAAESPLCEHVLYEIQAQNYESDIPVELHTS